VVSAFQRHFRPALIDGKLDSSTLITLRSLIEASRFGRASHASQATDAPAEPQT
jgi:hypothetical protein